MFWFSVNFFILFYEIFEVMLFDVVRKVVDVDMVVLLGGFMNVVYYLFVSYSLIFVWVMRGGVFEFWVWIFSRSVWFSYGWVILVMVVVVMVLWVVFRREGVVFVWFFWVLWFLMRGFGVFVLCMVSILLLWIKKCWENCFFC